MTIFQKKIYFFRMRDSKTFKMSLGRCLDLYSFSSYFISGKKTSISPRARRYDRAGSRQLLGEFLELAEAVEERSEEARCCYMNNRIGDTLDSAKNFWKKMRNLGLILRPVTLYMALCQKSLISISLVLPPFRRKTLLSPSQA